MSKAKNCSLVSLLSLVRKIFEKLLNNRLLEKCSFSDFQHGFRSSRSTPDLLTGVSNRIARVFDRSGAVRCSTWYIQGFQQGLACCAYSQTQTLCYFSSFFGFISSFPSNRRLRRLNNAILCKNIWLWLGFFKVPFFSCHILMTFVIMLSLILLSMLKILPYILYVSWNLNLICEIL